MTSIFSRSKKSASGTATPDSTTEITDDMAAVQLSEEEGSVNGELGSADSPDSESGKQSSSLQTDSLDSLLTTTCEPRLR